MKSYVASNALRAYEKLNNEKKNLKDKSREWNIMSVIFNELKYIT